MFCGAQVYDGVLEGAARDHIMEIQQMTTMTQASQQRETAALDMIPRRELMVDSRAYDAQAEVFWLAFQALPPRTRQIVRDRLLQAAPFGSELAQELASWQAAANEALWSFEAMLDDPT